MGSRIHWFTEFRFHKWQLNRPCYLNQCKELDRLIECLNSFKWRLIHGSEWWRWRWRRMVSLQKGWSSWLISTSTADNLAAPANNQIEAIEAILKKDYKDEGKSLSEETLIKTIDYLQHRYDCVESSTCSLFIFQLRQNLNEKFSLKLQPNITGEILSAVFWPPCITQNTVPRELKFAAKDAELKSTKKLVYKNLRLRD